MSCSSTIIGLRCRVENKIKNKKNVKRSEWNVLYISWVCLYVCVCVVCVLVCLHVSLYSWGQPFFPSSFWRECVSVCVFLHSPQGLFQLRRKNTEKLWKSFLCTFEWNDPKKGFSWEKIKKYSGFHIQKGTYPITKLPSPISTSISPSCILRPVCVCVVCGLPWAKSMSLVVVNVGHVSEYKVSQPFVTTFLALFRIQIMPPETRKKERASFDNHTLNQVK